MRKFTIALGLFLSVAGLLFGAKEQKTGYVDIKYILGNYRTAIDAQRAFETEVNRYNQIADSLKNLYDQARIGLDAQKLMLSEQGFTARQIEVNQLKKRYDDYVIEIWSKGGKYDQKNRELVSPVVARIKTTVNKIAAKEGFSIVLDASETKIVYAETNLDLTDKILDELNKEYTATIVPPPATKPTKDLTIAVFPFFEENQTAQEENIGELIRRYTFDILRNTPQVRMITNAEVNNALITRNIQLTNQISEPDAFSIGLMLQADYVVIGSCSKQGNKVNFSITVLEPIAGQLTYQGSGDALKKEEVKQPLGAQIQQVFRKIRPSGK